MFVIGKALGPFGRRFALADSIRQDFKIGLGEGEHGFKKTIYCGKQIMSVICVLNLGILRYGLA